MEEEEEEKWKRNNFLSDLKYQHTLYISLLTYKASFQLRQNKRFQRKFLCEFGMSRDLIFLKGVKCFSIVVGF